MNTSMQEWLLRPDGLATRLRALRTQAGLSVREAARQLDWQASRLSRIETAQQMPTALDLDAIAALTAPDDPRVTLQLRKKLDETIYRQTNFRQRVIDGHVDLQQDYNELVRQSQRVVFFEVAYVPGLAQTPDYMRRVFSESVRRHHGQNDVEEAIATRLRRTEYLYDTGRRFEFLMTEAVIRFLLPESSAVMYAQLDRLLSLSRLPNVRLGIIPFGIHLPITPQRGFQIYGDTGAVEDFLKHEYLYDDDLAKLEEVLAELWGEAFEGDDARRLIVDAQAALQKAIGEYEG
ncbi:MAG: helix-turn-helix domain-containing protein [Actinomycetia bacterium]|nr:helix-turn-helix domain-containing protein [Actinomycetes bacterium]